MALQGGVLNSVDRFAAAAATPILLNLFLIAALLVDAAGSAGMTAAPSPGRLPAPASPNSCG